MKIAFIHNHKAFLPELAAYQDFFQKQNIQTCIEKYGEEELSDADVYWYFMGFYPKSKYKKKLIIHEYASASVPPYRKLKDFLKSRLNPRPHFRLYLNEYVREQINIHDEVPFGFRDMGICEEFFYPKPNTEKEYDFIYSGNLSSERNLGDLLKHFDNGALKNQTILMLGNDESGLAQKYGHCKNIYFQSAVPWQEVPGWIARARYAVNYIPDKEPFNAQTSTKFLEYAAMKIPVISSNYFWISEFRERYGGNYFLLKDDFSNMTWDRIRVFHFEFPKMESWRWEEKIRDSGVLEFLRQA
ncbi:MAG TPA: glycosyltransferase [Puia sp.]|jgi:glycosyltransferase involved in cell wall biosynthesis